MQSYRRGKRPHRTREIPSNFRVLPFRHGALVLLERTRSLPPRRETCDPLFPVDCSSQAFAGAAALGAACDEQLSQLAGPSPNLEPTFTSIQHEIFETTDASGRAACTQCHTDSGRTPSGGLNLRHDVAYANLVSIASRGKAGAVRVVPGDADDSYVLHKLAGSSDIVGERMPRTGSLASDFFSLDSSA